MSKFEELKKMTADINRSVECRKQLELELSITIKHDSGSLNRGLMVRVSYEESDSLDFMIDNQRSGVKIADLPKLITYLEQFVEKKGEGGNEK